MISGIMHHQEYQAARAQSNFLWAYATLGERLGNASLKALVTQAQKQLPHFTAQGLTNIMWAFPKVNHSPDATLLRSCEAHAARISSAYIPQDLVRFSLFVRNQKCLPTVDRGDELGFCTSAQTLRDDMCTFV